MTVPVEQLAGVRAFRELSSTELAGLAANAEELAVPAGTELAREGDFGHSVFVVVDGAAQVTVDGAAVRELGTGDVFGEVAVVASGRRTASVTASTPMTLISLFKRDIWELEKQNAAFGDRLRTLTEPRPTSSL